MSFLDFIFGKKETEDIPPPPPTPSRDLIWQKVVRAVGHTIDNIPEEHWAVFHRKRTRLLIKDEYGTLDNTAWEREKLQYINKHIMPQIDFFDGCILNEYIDLDNKSVYLYNDKGKHKLHQMFFSLWIEQILIAEEGKYKSIVENENCRTRPSNPYEYEHYCAQLLRANDWDVGVTKATGDQGADIRAVKNGVTIVVQCKLFSSPVGNKAVQEVYASQKFYAATYGVVITNNGFTKSARQLAAASNVFLLHDTEIEKLDDLLRVKQTPCRNPARTIKKKP